MRGYEVLINIALQNNYNLEQLAQLGRQEGYNQDQLIQLINIAKGNQQPQQPQQPLYNQPPQIDNYDQFGGQVNHFTPQQPVQTGSTRAMEQNINTDRHSSRATEPTAAVEPLIVPPVMETEVPELDLSSATYITRVPPLPPTDEFVLDFTFKDNNVTFKLNDLNNDRFTGEEYEQY